MGWVIEATLLVVGLGGFAAVIAWYTRGRGSGDASGVTGSEPWLDASASSDGGCGSSDGGCDIGGLD